MPLYETVLITRQDLTVDDVDNLITKMTKIITDGKGKIVNKEYWGLRSLAFPIKKNVRGHYVLLNIDSEYAAVAELQRIMKYNEDVVRSQIFKVKSHIKESPQFISSDAKDYKKPKEEKEPSKIDLIIERFQFDN